MKIAVLGILAQPISKDALGGTEIFTANLVDELVSRGHEVALFATSDSRVNAKVIGDLDSQYFCQTDKPNTLVRRAITAQVEMYTKFLICQEEFDFVHVSAAEWYSFLPFIQFLKIPHCITVHNKLLNDEDLKILFSKYPKANFVFAQDSQINSFPKAQNSFMIPSGININDYYYNENPDDYLSWLGRLVAGKGLEYLPEIQKKTGKIIKFGGGGESSDFFAGIIKPQLENRNLVFLGPQDLKKKNNLFGQSLAFINPRIMKPIGGVAGLVVAEANACGTPVISYDSEGMREIIKDGVNGFLVESGNLTAFCDKVNKLYKMSKEEYQKLRRSTRKYAEDSFSHIKMVDEYEKLYRKLKKEFNAQN